MDKASIKWNESAKQKQSEKGKVVGVSMGDLSLTERNRRSWWTPTDRVQFLPWWLSRDIFEISTKLDLYELHDHSQVSHLFPSFFGMPLKNPPPTKKKKKKDFGQLNKSAV